MDVAGRAGKPKTTDFSDIRTTANFATVTAFLHLISERPIEQLPEPLQAEAIFLHNLTHAYAASAVIGGINAWLVKA